MSRISMLALTASAIALAVSAPNAQGQTTFPGPELLGRPTNESVAVNVVANTAIDAYFEYGTQPGAYVGRTDTVSAPANEPLEGVIAGLQSDTRYYYRMVYRPLGSSTWIAREERSFHTQRAVGSPFTFTVTADSHVNILFGDTALYQRTLLNVAEDQPDFHLDLGDTFAMDNVTTQAQARNAYLSQRPYFGLIGHSAPVFLALGNHEQEEAWHLDDTGNVATSKPVLGANARKRYFLNPVPDGFYSGNIETFPAIDDDHLAEDYYAWTWGNALFVVIDPYWYTTRKPFIGNTGGGESSDVGSGDRWDWTLGTTQYLWLKDTLEGSTAKFKFIFAHHGTGGTSDYIREGANGVPYTEWGGHDEDGTTWAFGTRRPGWDKPVHQLLVDTGVTAFFHGHDHEFAHEERDGVVYQLVPMAAGGYGFGSFQLYDESDPHTIRVLPNSGHLRVTVDASGATVDYVRSFLPGDGANAQVEYSYRMGESDTTPVITVNGASPNAGAGTVQTFDLQYGSTNGADDLRTAWVWFNDSLAASAARSCLLYVEPAGRLFLLDDAGATWQTAQLGSSAVLQNSQCAVAAGNSRAVSSGDTLTLTLAMTFKPAYAGTKRTFMFAANSAGAFSGWQERGTWVIPGASLPVTADAVTPSTGSGTTQVFALDYSSTPDAGDLAATWVWFNESLATSAARSCLVYYAPPTNSLFLLDDTGLTWQTAALGSAVVLENSQCAVAAGASYVSPNERAFTLNLAVSFRPAFAGPKRVYLFAAASTGAISGWHERGGWIVTEGPVTAGAVNPASGTGARQTFSLEYSSTRGAADVRAAWVWFNSSLESSAAGSCLAYYSPATDELFLLDDGGTRWQSASLGGAGLLQNSQCAIAPATSSVDFGGNVVSLTLDVAFTPAFAGAKNIYLFAAGSDGTTSGWHDRGDWSAP